MREAAGSYELVNGRLVLPDNAANQSQSQSSSSSRRSSSSSSSSSSKHSGSDTSQQRDTVFSTRR